MGNIKAGGIIENIDLAQISILNIPDRPGIASYVFNALFEKNVNVQFIAQIIELNSISHIAICVSKENLEFARSAIENANLDIHAEKIIYHPNVAMISVFGPHFRDHPGIAGMIFSALASVNINILAISTSISSISCVIEGEFLKKAVEVLRKTFDLPPSTIYIASDGITLRYNNT